MRLIYIKKKSKKQTNNHCMHTKNVEEKSAKLEYDANFNKLAMEATYGPTKFFS